MAAREASVQTSQSVALTVAKDTVEKILRSNGMAIQNTNVSIYASGGWAKGHELTVTATTTYETLFPIPIGNGSDFTTKSNTMKSDIVVLIER